MATLLLPRNRPSFYHRSLVPRRLRPYFKGKSQLWRSLSTKNKDQATLKSAQWQARIQRIFITLKRHGARMTPSEIETLIARWMDSSLEVSEDYRSLRPVTDDYLEGVQMALDTQAHETDEALADCNYSKIATEADALLQVAGRPLLKHDSLDFKRLCRRLLLAKEDVLHIEADRWNGEYKNYRPVPATPLSLGTAPVAVPVVSPLVKKSPLFSEIAKKYLKEIPRARNEANHVAAEYQKFLVAIGGDRPILSITKTECRAYKDSMLQARHLSFATVTKHLSILSGLFRWAENQGYLPDSAPNPIKGLTPNLRETKKQATQRLPFEDAELVTIFSMDDFRQQQQKNPARYWVPMLCLFQLCRREEAAQLALKDMGNQDGIPFMNITNLGDDQSLKTDGSKRKIPIHSSLIALGFLDYVQTIRAAGHKRLFPQLTRSAHGYGGAVGAWFTRLKRKAGITDPGKVLHSFRHGVYRLNNAGCPQNICEMLEGHTPSSVHDRTYAQRELTPLSLLRDGLEKLRYDEVVKVLTK